AGWDAALAAEVGVRPEQLPELAPTGAECARIGGPDGPALASGCIDAFAEQLVAGADDDGDGLVILGTTLIVWAVTASEERVPDHYVIPHPAPGKTLGGARRNASGLVRKWLSSVLTTAASPGHPPRAAAAQGKVDPQGRRDASPPRQEVFSGRRRRHVHGHPPNSYRASGGRGRAREAGCSRGRRGAGLVALMRGASKGLRGAEPVAADR